MIRPERNHRCPPVHHAAPVTPSRATATPVFVNGMAPLTDPVQSAQAIKLSDRVTPDLAFDSEPRRPPVPNYTHWSKRPEVRAGFTLAPLLTLLAWRQLRARRAERARHAGRVVRVESRPAEPDDQTIAASERKRGTTPRAPRQPSRGPGDRRRSDRRRN